MAAGAQAFYREMDTQVSGLLSPSRVMDGRELDRLAARRSISRNSGRGSRRPSVIHGGNCSEPAEARMGSVRPDPLRAGSQRVNRIRLAARVSLAVVIMVALLVVFSIPRAGADRGPVPAVSHVVQPGDTLWSIAELYTPATGDVRAAVSLIRSANEATSGLLAVGDVIEVPVGKIPGALSRALDRGPTGVLSVDE